MSKQTIFIPTCLLISFISFVLTRNLVPILAILIVMWGVTKLYESYQQQPTAKANRYDQQLIMAVNGDRALAERLIQYEKKRFPAETQPEWAERALARLLRDRR